MTEWALCMQQMPHDPSRPSESIEYKIMIMGQVCRGSGVSDGGMFRSYQRHRRDIAQSQRVAEISRIVGRLKRVKPDHYLVLTHAFMDRPGYICDSRIAAQLVDISQNKYLRIYGELMAYMEGRLDKMAA